MVRQEQNVDDVQSPFDGHSDTVKPEWIDFNGHFNAGFYVVCFDDAIESWMDFIGLGRPHREVHAVTTFSAQNHVTYLREVQEGANLRVLLNYWVLIGSESTRFKLCGTWMRISSRLHVK